MTRRLHPDADPRITTTALVGKGSAGWRDGQIGGYVWQHGHRDDVREAEVRARIDQVRASLTGTPQPSQPQAPVPPACDDAGRASRIRRLRKVNHGELAEETPTRCPDCGYLLSSIGHRLECGDGHA